MKKVIRDGMVAVLVSPGFGAGWSTWSGKFKEWALFSPEVVAWVEAGKPKDRIDDIVKEALGEEYFYTGGAIDLEIEWVKQGTFFQVTDYDGNESLEIMGEMDWSVA